MPATGLLALLDDVGTMAKVAAKKTAGISGDDLAVNSEALSGGGITPERELHVVYEVAKGSLKNKFFYLIPGALALSAFAPWAIAPLMMVGGAYLAYEGVEKVLHKDKHKEEKKDDKTPEQIEKEKIAGAIKTDFILSAEIVVVSLGAMAAAPFLVQVAALAAVGVAMTAGIYGLVGGIVKLDDIGLKMAEKKGDGPFAKATRAMGRGLVKAVPWLMKGISILGTAAMFSVGGGILLHGIPAAAHAVEGLIHLAPHGIAPVLGIVAEMGAGVVAGLAAIPAVKVMEKPVKAIANLFGKVKDKLSRKKTPEKAGAEPAPVVIPVPANANEPSGDALKSVPDLKAAHNAAAEKPAAEKTVETQEIQQVVRDDKKRHVSP